MPETTKTTLYTAVNGFPRRAGNKLIIKSINRWLDTAKVGDKFIITLGGSV